MDSRSSLAAGGEGARERKPVVPLKISWKAFRKCDVWVGSVLRLLLLLWRLVVSDSLQPQGLQPASIFYPWNFLGNNTGMGGVPFPTLGYLPDPEIEPAFLTSPAFAGRFLTTSAPWEALYLDWKQLNFPPPSAWHACSASFPSSPSEETSSLYWNILGPHLTIRIISLLGIKKSIYWLIPKY